MRRALWPLLLILFLHGCSQLQPREPIASVDPAQVLQLEHWSLEGRIGIRYAGDSNSAGLSWENRANAYEISLRGPLGQGGLRIEGDDQSVSLQRSGSDEIHRAATPEALMRQLLGWHLPLSQAGFWVRGLPDPTLPWQPLPSGQGFTQGGWQIEYDRYTQTDALVLPEKIRMTRPDLRITLVINRWKTDLSS